MNQVEPRLDGFLEHGIVLRVFVEAENETRLAIDQNHSVRVQQLALTSGGAVFKKNVVASTAKTTDGVALLIRIKLN